jgi:hypothetical protein
MYSLGTHCSRSMLLPVPPALPALRCVCCPALACTLCLASVPEMHALPAPHCAALRRAGISMLLSGDMSQWDRALQMPHYNTYSMPALSFHTGDHLLQVRQY